MKELTFKKKGVVHTPLTFWQVDSTSKIAIYQGGRGARPDLDFIVKHKEEGKRLRTPSHTHWIVDLIAKKQFILLAKHVHIYSVYLEVCVKFKC